MHRRFMYRLVVLAVAVAIAAVTAAVGASHGPSLVTICLNGHTQQLPAQAAAVVLAHNPHAHAGACQPNGGSGGDPGDMPGAPGAAMSSAVGSTNGVYRCNVWNGLYIVQSDKLADDTAHGGRYANVILGKPYTGAPNTNPLQGSTVGHLACTSEGATLIPGVVSDAKGYLYDPKLTGVGYGIGSLVYQG